MRDTSDRLRPLSKQINGVLSATPAMIACGIQPEFVTHLMLQCASMKQSIILRAGDIGPDGLPISPPVFNQRRGTKGGGNLTKTSTEGLLKGSIAAEARFTRYKCGKRMGHHKDDRKNLTLSLRDPSYQHTAVLPVTMQDILRGISPQGDMHVLGFNDGKLRLAYRKDRANNDFSGQFLIDLTKGDATPVIYSRPWDRPDYQAPSLHPQVSMWDPIKKIITKPAELNDLPDEIYEIVFSNLFTVAYTEHQNERVHPDEIKDLKVFANTPKTATDLLDAIKESKILTGDSVKNKQAYAAISKMDATTPMYEILAVLSQKKIKILYDRCGLVTTGDWDGLALGHPPLGRLKGFPSEKMRVYNTFKLSIKGITERRDLVEASCHYVRYLQADPDIAKTPLGTLLQKIKDPLLLFSETAVKRAGCITPHEFVFQQLINYSYRDIHDSAYGGTVGVDNLQLSLDAGLFAFTQVKEDPRFNNNQRFDHCLRASLAIYNEGTSRIAPKSPPNPVVSAQLKEHLENHLKIAIHKRGIPYEIPHPDHDANAPEPLFQHGFEMRNPYGCNLDGAWVMITDEGQILYGQNQQQLISVLLTGDFLEKNIIDITPAADMNMGWGLVIKRQRELKQFIPNETLRQYAIWEKEGSIVFSSSTDRAMSMNKSASLANKVSSPTFFSTFNSPAFDPNASEDASASAAPPNEQDTAMCSPPERQTIVSYKWKKLTIDSSPDNSSSDDDELCVDDASACSPSSGKLSASSSSASASSTSVSVVDMPSEDDEPEVKPDVGSAANIISP